MQRKRLRAENSIKRGLGWTPIYVATAVIVLAVAAALIFFVDRRANAQYERELRADVQYDLDKAALDLTLVFQRNADTIRAISALISIEPDLPVDRFKDFSSQIFEDHSDFLRVSAAPNMVVDRVYPDAYSANLVGYDYRAIQHREAFDKIQRAKKSGEVLFIGPVNLPQGGQGVMGYRFVHTVDQDPGAEPWGLINLVIDYEQELAQIGFDQLPYRLSIRGKDARGGHGAIFWGDKATFTADPVFATVDLPIGSWLLAAAPLDGWKPTGGGIRSFHFWVAGATIFVVLGLFVVIRLTQLRIRSDAQMTSAINSIQDGFAYYDADDCLVACNDTYREFHGGAKKLFREGTRFEDILRSGVSRGHYPEAIGREEEWLHEQLTHHMKSNRTIEHRLDNGRWVRMSESRTPDGGSVSFLIDITEVMSAKEEAEQANLSRSEFLDLMSHELRTPLTVVLGGTPFLVKPELLPATQKVFSRLDSMGEAGEKISKDIDVMMNTYKSLAGKVERSARNLLTLINEVLDFSKIEAGRMTLAPEPVSCEEIINDVVDAHREKVAEKGLTIEVECADMDVNADAPRAKQVLGNLISNAIKFTEEGRIRVESQSFGDFVRFRVIDTGVGIPHDKISGIFDKFSQANTSDRRKAGGTGLGLAISKKFVEMHGGAINVSSMVGHGSEFSFTLPKHVVQKKQVARPMRQKPAA
jgi:signal transduction histidine kinase